MSGEQDFWTRRRAAVEAEDAVDQNALAAERDAAAKAELDGKTDTELLEELGLPDPDRMEQGDDFSGFMAKAVPEHLRKRALRKLWRSNPVLACVDGLNEYDLDYTNAATDAPGVVTAYQVGKGMLDHILELARKEEEVGPQDMEPQEADCEDVEPDAENIAEATEAPEETAPETMSGPEAEISLPRRRMRFDFEEGAA